MYFQTQVHGYILVSFWVEYSIDYTHYQLSYLIMSPLHALLFSHLFTVAQHYLESTHTARLT